MTSNRLLNPKLSEKKSANPEKTVLQTDEEMEGRTNKRTNGQG